MQLYSCTRDSSMPRAGARLSHVQNQSYTKRRKSAPACHDVNPCCANVTALKACAELVAAYVQMLFSSRVVPASETRLAACFMQVRSKPYGTGPDEALSQRLTEAETASAEAQRALHIANSSAAEAAR